MVYALLHNRYTQAGSRLRATLAALQALSPMFMKVDTDGESGAGIGSGGGGGGGSGSGVGGDNNSASGTSLPPSASSSLFTSSAPLQTAAAPVFLTAAIWDAFEADARGQHEEALKGCVLLLGRCIN